MDTASLQRGRDSYAAQPRSHFSSRNGLPGRRIPYAVRLWTLHPCYLDAQGLVAVWREALLAQKVLSGLTHGYRNHPQLTRFRELENPLAGIASYLAGLHAEAQKRGYRFDSGKIAAARLNGHIDASTGQVAYEMTHLCRKLAIRAPLKYAESLDVVVPDVHPLFRVVEGGVAAWEKLDDSIAAAGK